MNIVTFQASNSIFIKRQMQNSGLVNFVPEWSLPFVQISSCLLYTSDAADE